MPLDTAKDPRVALLLALPPQVARALALPGGLAPETLHITVAYLGRRSQLSVPAAQLVGDLRQVAAAAAPLVGQVGGVLRFPASNTSESLDPFCAAVDLPGLVELREQLRQALAKRGVALPDQHGYVPHVHLMALDPAAPMPVQQIPAQPVRLEELLLKEGGWSISLPLGSAAARYQRCFRGPALPLEQPVTPEPRVGVWDQCLRYGLFDKEALDGRPLRTRFAAETCAQMLEDFRDRPQDMFLDKFHKVTEEVQPGGKSNAELDQQLKEWGEGHALAWYSALAHVHDGAVVGYASHPGASDQPPTLSDLARPDGKPPGDGLYALRTQLTPLGLDPKEGISTFRYVSPYFVQTGEATGYRLLNITATNDPYLEGVALAMSRELPRPSPKESTMPMDQSALMMAAGCADADTAEQKLQKLGAYAAKMAEERDAAALARKKMEDDAKAKSPAAEAAPLAGAETPAEEKAEKLVQQAMERRLKTAEEAAAKAQTLADKLEAERQGERVQAFSRWALAGPVEEGGSRWPKEDEKGLHELIKDMGGDLDKAKKHVMRLPVPQAMQRLTRGGNPAGAAGVDPPTFQAMNREQRGQTFSRLTREKMKADPKLTLAEAQQAVDREHPGLYTC